MPNTCKALTCSAKSITPKTTTKTGSKTDKIDTFSALMYFMLLSKNSIGKAVHIIAIPKIYSQTNKVLGIKKLESSKANTKQERAHPKETIKLETSGESRTTFFFVVSMYKE